MGTPQRIKNGDRKLEYYPDASYDGLGGKTFSYLTTPVKAGIEAIEWISDEVRGLTEGSEESAYKNSISNLAKIVNFKTAGAIMGGAAGTLATVGAIYASFNELTGGDQVITPILTTAYSWATWPLIRDFTLVGGGVGYILGGKIDCQKGLNRHQINSG